MELLIADDHDLVRDALSALLTFEDPATKVTQARDIAEALQVLRNGKAFDIILLDLRMPGMNGLQGAKQMLEAAGTTPIMMMSGTANSADVHAALNLGIRGFVPKTLAGKSLINALRLVACGETYVPMEFLNPKASGQSSQGITLALTPREQEVLTQLRLGSSNKEISRILSIAEPTVKLHLRTLSTKLAARNRTDIIVRAIECGLA